MKWFRMHTSLIDSVKVGPLSHSAFRAYVELQCLAGEKDDGGRTGVTPDTINWRLRRDVSGDVTTLVTSGLVTVNGDSEYVVERWDEKQYKSDTSASRTRDYRARLKAKSAIEKGNTASDVTGDGSDDGCDGARTDTETETEQKEPARKRAAPVELKTFLESLKHSGEKFLGDDDAIWAYAESVGVSDEMLRLAFLKFKDRYLDGKKRYTDWRRVFRTSVKERWMKLWYLDAATGKVQLTTDGRLAMEQFKADTVLRRVA